MSAIHVANSSPKARELVDDVRAEFNVWLENCINQAEAIGLDKRGAARFALLDMMGELSDHLVIRFGITLASWGDDGGAS